MTPQDIASDIELIVPFLATVGHLSSMPSESLDLDVLLSGEGTRVIAVLWPEQEYDVELDLSLEQYKYLSTEESLDLEIQHRDTVADRFNELLRLAAQTCDRALSDVKAHVVWSANVSDRELEKLLNGHGTFDLSVVAGACEALHLEFSNDWVVRDAVRLARRVDRSLVALQVVDRLHRLSVEALTGLAGKLPKGASDADQAFDPATDRPAPPKGRYAALYASLTGEAQDRPTYSLAKIDEILVNGDESPLPPNARNDRSWWAGTGAKAKGRPQIRAWWAAGYRIHQIRTEGDGTSVSAVQFERLSALGGVKEVTESTPAVAAGLTPSDPVATESRSGAKEPADDDTRALRGFLENQGEANRVQIQKMFLDGGRSEIDGSWLTNLLTRARRQGWIVRYGTRSRPRWVATGSFGDRMLWIAGTLGFDWPSVDPGKVPAEYLKMVANRLNLDVAEQVTVVDVARAIIEFGGQHWEAGFVRDGELQPRGMEAVLYVVARSRARLAAQGSAAQSDGVG